MCEESTSICKLPSAISTSDENILTKSPLSTIVPKTKYIRPKDFCFYCCFEVQNFARHLKRNHENEIEVEKIFSKKPKSKDRKMLLDLLRKKGNYIANINECTRPVKNQNTVNKRKLPCTYCRGFYSTTQLWRHRKGCSANPTAEKLPKSAVDGQNYLTRHIDIDQNLREIVFPRMQPDDISMCAKKDILICAFGARYLKTHREKHSVHVISRKMRELSKILIECRKLNLNIKSLFDVLKPEYYDLIVKVTKILAKYDKIKNTYESPSLALTIGTLMKQSCELALTFAIKKKYGYQYYLADDAQKEIQTLIQLIESQWRFDISSQASEDLSMKKWNKITIVPLASDLKLLRGFLLFKASNAIQELNINNENENAYVTLMETVFCRVILLNRKRPGELQRLLLHHYETINKANEVSQYEEFGEAISFTEKVLLKKFKRIVIRGKRNRGVPVLFSDDVQEHINILLKYRATFIPPINPYLFAKPKLTSHLIGYKVLQKYAQTSGAKNPHAITCTRLRKHLATLTQMFNMSEGDVEQLATFMGHTPGIHKMSYRLPDDIYQTAKVSKLLLLMEKGAAGSNKGKTLDEIEVDMEENLLTQNSDESENEEEYIENVAPLDNSVTKPKEANQHQIVNESKKKRLLVRWTVEQKNIVLKFFKDHISHKKPPKKKEIEVLLNKYPTILHNKDWLKIKVFIQNTYSKT